MNVAAHLLLGLALLTLQSSSVFPFAWGTISADLILCLVIHLATTRDLSEGGGSVLCLGVLSDVASGCPVGLHVVTYIAVFLVIWSLRHRMFLHTVPVLVTITLFGSVLATLMSWVATAIFVLDYQRYMIFLLDGIPRALVTVPFVFPVRSVALAIDQRTLSRRRWMAASYLGRG